MNLIIFLPIMHQIANNKLSILLIIYYFIIFQQRAGVENVSLATMGKNLKGKVSQLPDSSIFHGQQKPEMTQSTLRYII